MTDPAVASHPPVVVSLTEWSKYAPQNEEQRLARVAYVGRELERLEAEGIAPLYAAVTLPFAAQQTEAFEALRDRGQRFSLRLVAGCSPPTCDPQGRELPERDRGKVLVAKVGQRRFASGPERAAAASRGGDVLVTRRLTETPQTFDLEEAITIMRQWGYGVRPKRAARKDGGPRRDEWLVVQVREDGQPFAPPDPADAPPPPPRRSPRQASL